MAIAECKVTLHLFEQAKPLAEYLGAPYKQYFD